MLQALFQLLLRTKFPGHVPTVKLHEVLNQQLVLKALLLVQFEFGFELHHHSLERSCAGKVALQSLQLHLLVGQKSIVLLNGLTKLFVIGCHQHLLLLKLFPQSNILLNDIGCDAQPFILF